MPEIPEKVVLVVLAALVASSVNPWLERVKARTAAEYWETHERWLFTRDVASQLSLPRSEPSVMGTRRSGPTRRDLAGEVPA